MEEISDTLAKPLELSQSEALWAEQTALIPTGAQTFSKAPFQHVAGVSPKLLQRGKGSRVWDVDGNQYVDFMLGLGPAILGHGDEDVAASVASAMAGGIAMSLPHPLEAELARKLVELIPCAEMVRFGKNGSDATAGAVRAARAITGRDLIACCGYHGWQDWYIGTTTRCKGVPESTRELTLKFEYNKIDTLARLFELNLGKIAAVIMEPVTFHEPENDFLANVRDLTHRNGALLIFDEIITGFRMAMGGAQEHYGIAPDLACFGKAMGNGLPISAVVGTAEYMKIFEEIFFSFTYGGELASIAASLATIQKLERLGGISHIHVMGQRLLSGFDQIRKSRGVEDLVKMIGFPFWPEYIFQSRNGIKAIEIQSLFQQEIVRRGILTRAGMFISTAHSESDIDFALEVFDDAIPVVRSAVEKRCVLDLLDGEVIQPVIRAPNAN